MKVAGIDVGGERKGFHAVAARGGQVIGGPQRFGSAETAAEWVRVVGAEVVAIDAPCRWSVTGRARPAERALMKEKIWCFLDAALCALTAQAFAENRFATYGDAAEGFIVVPKSTAQGC